MAMTVIGVLLDEAVARLPEDERRILLGEFERLANAEPGRDALAPYFRLV